MTELLQHLSAALADRFRLEREVGAGGMATVYLAEDLRHHRKVAVKVLRPDLTAALGPERFLREVTIAANLQHPHILPVYDSGQADGLLYYVMPYVDGTSLAERLAHDGALSVPEAIHILRDVADALACAHQRGIVHRDIKPHNVMLSGRHALVADFGVAKAVRAATGGSSLTREGVALGTPAYMAPEQVSGDSNADHRADIYSFGALAYEVLTGHPPFAGLTSRAVLTAHLADVPVDIATHRPSIPPDLAQLVMRCLRKDPADRWQSSEELLQQLIAMETPSAETRRPALAGFAGRQSSRLILAGVILAIVAAVAVLVIRSRGGDPGLNSRHVLVAPFVNVSDDPAVSTFASLLETTLKEGLERTGMADVIDSRARHLARKTGAGFLVTGRYLVVGDSLQVEAELVDLSDRIEPARIMAVRTSKSSPEAGLALLTQRVMGALAVATDPRWGMRFVPGLVAPTFESYREYQLGDDALLDLRYSESFAHLSRAFAMDTNFFGYAIRAAYVLNNAGDSRGVDSIGRLLAPRLPRLSEFERHYLSRVLAWNRGDFEGALRSARGMAAVAPRSPFAAYAVARSALHAYRLDEAVSALRRFRPRAGEMTPDDYYSDLTWAYHLLERFEDERRAVEAWERDPGMARPVGMYGVRLRVAAATGRTDSVPVIVGRLLTSGSSIATMQEATLVVAAREFHWHGLQDVSAALASEVLRLGLHKPANVLRVEALSMLGRLDAATAALDSVEQTSGPRWELAAARGVFAARRNDRAGAEMADSLLQEVVDQSSGGAVAVSWRARIWAQLGDLPVAVALLRRASARGITRGSFHADPLLEPLRGDAAFVDLTRPRD